MKKKILSLALALVMSISLMSTVMVYAYGSHYLEENSQRYVEYQDGHPNMPFDTIVAYVNANVDKGFYQHIEVVQNPNDISVLLNKNFILPAGFAPSDLEAIGGGHRLRSEAAGMYNAMRAEMRDNGLNIYVRSSYRNHRSQTNSYNAVLRRSGRAAADRQVARPGHSEHQLGLSVDLAHRARTTGSLGSMGFSSSSEYTWLVENGHRYGFILRYPNGYTDIHGFIYEPWHWRYVGVEIATVMKNEGISVFEEYWGKYLAPAVVA